MRRRRALLVGVAAVVAAADLAVEAHDPVYGDPRGALFVVVALVLAAAVIAAVPRVPSTALAAGGGFATGGALGNLLSALVFAHGIPNPLIAGGLAFNVADVCVLAGACWLVAGSAAFALRHPGLLRRPV